MIFVDTSAIVAATIETDPQHEVAARALAEVLIAGDGVTHNYVVVETAAVLQRLRGIEPVRQFVESTAPELRVEWVDRELHRAGAAALLAADRRRLSLVDCISFEVMRRLGIDTALAFDPHFTEQGFGVVPA